MMKFSITGWARNHPAIAPRTMAIAPISTRRRSSARCSPRAIRPSAFFWRRRDAVTATGSQLGGSEVARGLADGLVGPLGARSRLTHDLALQRLGRLRPPLALCGVLVLVLHLLDLGLEDPHRLPETPGHVGQPAAAEQDDDDHQDQQEVRRLLEKAHEDVLSARARDDARISDRCHGTRNHAEPVDRLPRRAI